ncbi:hypothetical protein An07g01180 [Aspergillus niger]|uniref:Uncharacterized protein n=2 Tax=Aspergillus niger TaxID=5061 RepID=A2QM84_ASPNC|nr:hypothetical protein An07g01180 [Aspergillus niger]CAK96565.1 hypothetical protein An07g01180 [Aspergillus niger]
MPMPVATSNKVIVTAFNVGSLSRAVSRMPDLEWLRGHAESEMDIGIRKIMAEAVAQISAFRLPALSIR